MRRPPRPLSERRPRRAHISAAQLAALSHEFRTPLNGVLGMARLLEGTPLTAEQRAYAAAMRESGQHLLTLVNDVLDFAKLGSDSVELHPQPLEVEALLRSVAELLSPRAREKGVELGWSAPSGLKILADEGKLRQILLNFAGNAVKFTTEGGVLLAVTETEFGMRFTVEDTGPGVPAADRERIFQAFAQAEAGQAVIGGAGLGLAIARRLAQAMDGEVGVVPNKGGGSIFWFEAPFTSVAAAPATLPLTGRTIGVASPNPVLLRAARRQIQACGGRAVTAKDVDSLLAAVGPSDVLLLDEALSEGESLRAPPGRKAIVLLAAEQRERKDALRQAGFAAWLIKPLRQASLAEWVLIAAGATEDPAAPAEDDRLAPAAAPGARVLLVEDNPINALLARALLTREGCVVDHAAAGEEALAAVRVGAYDLILMDMRMPGLSGVETARQLRTAGIDTPIVALTANAFDDDRQACLAAGMDDFMVKPILPDSLRAVLTRWTRTRWTDQAQRAKVG
ncbi:response regulator [Phenylobacterium deserti]|uniref:histidine kinase n=1 Tax=Phenylobacterium deserti TaxID=1914756 RepID=A0A328AVP4_9CAUL|nr:response regulator [Phenylobacterium deserti]RAK58241.1 hybrid sensor histidine kinase/response regulator [Phenylobacterium deserti]